MSVSESRRMRGHVHVRLPAEMALPLRVAADGARISAAAYVRRILADHFRITDVVPARRSRGPRPLPAADVAELARLRAEIGRATGILKQTAVGLRTTGAQRLHIAAEEQIAAFGILGLSVSSLICSIERGSA